MRMLEVEQAIFASADRGSMRGYQLIAKSAGIDAACSQTLCRWSPTQLALEMDQWALSCFRISETMVAISRSLWGGSEYSGRGSAEVVTVMLILRDEQFSAYADHPLSVASTALAMGLLKLPFDVTSPLLERASLPPYPLVNRPPIAGEEPTPPVATIATLVELLTQQRRLAVIGATNPWGILARMLAQLPRPVRRQLSFTTGLTPTISRPFQVHFLATADAAMLHNIRSQNMVCLTAN